MQSIKNTKITRITARVLLICVICVALLLAVFILTNTNHEHDHSGVGGNCATCAQIHNNENLLKYLGVAVAAISFGLTSLFAAVGVLYSASSSVERYTPVNLKIRLNN